MIKTVTTRCPSCDQPFECKIVRFSGLQFLPPMCDPCGATAERKRRWYRICPYEFRTVLEDGRTTLDGMDRANPRWGQALDWQIDDRGLLIAGPPGTCKTRAMWRALKPVSDMFVPIRAISAGDFERGCRDAMHDGCMSDWMDEMATFPVVFIDDIFKMTLTDFVQSSLFDFIDIRAKNGLPLLATTNDTGETLGHRMSQDKHNPVLRRLRDFCTTIAFK